MVMMVGSISMDEYLPCASKCPLSFLLYSNWIENLRKLIDVLVVSCIVSHCLYTLLCFHYDRMDQTIQRGVVG